MDASNPVATAERTPIASRVRPGRRVADRVLILASTIATLLGIIVLGSILLMLIVEGVKGFSPALFTAPTPGPGSEGGGIANAILGSLIMTFLGILIATPIGLMAGTYLAEYGRTSKLADIIRFLNDVLLSAPSILIGLFVYTLIVVPMGRFSGWAGTVALAIIILPVVLRATEDMLRLVPTPLREAAFALGASHWTVVSAVQWKAARAGILTGLLLAVARAAGETAPLLFTAFGNPQFTVNLSSPMATLPVQIFNLTLSADPASIALAWAGALIITLGVLVLNIVSRLIIALGQRK